MYFSAQYLSYSYTPPEPTLFFIAQTWICYLIMVIGVVVLLRELYYKITKKRRVKGKYVLVALIIVYMTFVLIDANAKFSEIVYPEYNSK